MAYNRRQLQEISLDRVSVQNEVFLLDATVTAPQRPGRFLSLCYVYALPGCSASLNGHGLAVLMDYLPGPDARPGLPMDFVTWALVDLPSIDAVLDFLAATPRGGSGNCLLAQGARVVNVELTSTRMAVTEATGDGVFVHANHFLDPVLARAACSQRAPRAATRISASASSAWRMSFSRNNEPPRIAIRSKADRTTQSTRRNDMNTPGSKCSASTTARAFSRYAGTWAALCASLGMLGCVAIEEPTDSSALASEIRESVMRDSLGTELAPISAVIARSNAQADRDLNLLARVEVQPNEMLEIYEPSPGRLVVSGAGAPTGEALLPPHVLEGLSVEEIWDLAAGSAEMPGELRAAIAGARERMEAGAPAMQEGIELPEAPRAGALVTATPVAADLEPPSTSAGWCDTEYFSLGYGACLSVWNFEYCRDNRWGDGYHAWARGADFVYTNVCPATGPVVLHVNAPSGLGGDWDVVQNTVRWWQGSDLCGYWSGACETHVRVNEALNDRFHVRFYGFF